MTAFEEHCRNAVKRFLQTVVLVDDQALFRRDDAVPDEIDEPMDAEGPDDDAGGPDPEPARVVAADPNVAEALDAGAITAGFAEFGLICSVLKPSEGDDKNKQTETVAKRADVVILDWEMGKDGGQNAKRILQSIFEHDDEKDGRLRLVVIYTGLPNLIDVAESINRQFPELERGSKKKKLHLTLTKAKGPARVVVLGKRGGHAANEYQSFLESEETLPARIVKEFAAFAGGLLANTMLVSMAAIRNETHRMLARFSPAMDGPYLTHRAMIGSADDTAQLVARMIYDEIESQVSLTPVVEDFAGRDNVSAFLTHRLDKKGQHGLRLLFKEKEITHEFSVNHETALKIVEDGVAHIPEAAKDSLRDNGFSRGFVENDPPNLKSRKTLVYLLADDDENTANRNHMNFSMTSIVQRSNSEANAARRNERNTLKLGSLVAYEDVYYLCVTPYCDSVRLVKDRGFVFVKLKDKGGDFAIVFNDVDTSRKLQIDKSDINLTTFTMRKADDGTCRPILEDGRLVFPIAKAAAGAHLRWIADLKPMVAQQIIRKLTGHLSRVGLDEFEWLRIHGQTWA